MSVWLNQKTNYHILLNKFEIILNIIINFNFRLQTKPFSEITIPILENWHGSLVFEPRRFFLAEIRRRPDPVHPLEERRHPRVDKTGRRRQGRAWLNSLRRRQ